MRETVLDESEVALEVCGLALAYLNVAAALELVAVVARAVRLASGD